ALSHLPSLARPRRPGAPPFPYTTLFRSVSARSIGRLQRELGKPHGQEAAHALGEGRQPAVKEVVGLRKERKLRLHRQRADPAPRSEEHTSELQSRENLVCRLLLEKKNNR